MPGCFDARPHVSRSRRWLDPPEGVTPTCQGQRSLYSLDVDGIVRSPFGIDQRTTDEAGTRGWSVTHLPSGLAVVRQIKVLAVALTFVDRIAALTDWTVQEIGATPELRAQVQKALDQAYDDFYSGRLPPIPEDTSSAS